MHKRDVLRANVMNEKGARKYAVILAFDVPVSKEAREMAEEYKVHFRFSSSAQVKSNQINESLLRCTHLPSTCSVHIVAAGALSGVCLVLHT